MNYYLCRKPDIRSEPVTTTIALQWPVFMIVQTPQNPVPCWMYELVDGTLYYLEKTTKWEYDLMVAIEIPELPSDIIFYYAEGWKAKDVIRNLRNRKLR